MCLAIQSWYQCNSLSLFCFYKTATHQWIKRKNIFALKVMMYWFHKENCLVWQTPTCRMCIDECCIICVLCCVEQDGIISPETDSGFVGSESSRLTLAAAPSPLHQRASERWGRPTLLPCLHTNLLHHKFYLMCCPPPPQHTHTYKHSILMSDPPTLKPLIPLFFFKWLFSSKQTMSVFLSDHVFCVSCLCIFEYLSTVRQCFRASGGEASDRPSLSAISCFFTITQLHS